MATLARVERYLSIHCTTTVSFGPILMCCVKAFHTVSATAKVAGVLDLLRDDDSKDEEQEIRRIVVGHTPDDNVRLLCDGTLLVRTWMWCVLSRTVAR